MADSLSPIICVTCKRPFPDDLQADDAPRYFAQESLLPRSDEDNSFTNEARMILGFIETLTFVTRHSTETEQQHHEDILDLLYQLSDEATRRLQLADDAMREKSRRDHHPLTASSTVPAIALQCEKR